MAKKLKKKFKKKTNQYIKDKAIVDFILQHSEKENIDFSKIKIPSFSGCTSNEEDDIKSIKCDTLNEKFEQINIQEKNKIPNFGFSLLDLFAKDENESTRDIPEFKSTFFK